MKMQPVPIEWVHRAWTDAAPFIASALEYAHDGFTVEQAKVLVASGEWRLLVGVANDEVRGAMTVKFFNRTNDRVALVTAIGGRHVATRDCFEQLREFAVENGATVLEGAVRDSLARAWKHFGLEKKAVIVGVKL